MSWRKIKLIFEREIRDQLRDRRTLFMIAVLPLLLYPALGIGTVQMLLLFQEQPRTVVILGEDELPADPALLKQPEQSEKGPQRFVSKWFDNFDDADKLDVYTDSTLPQTGDFDADPDLKLLLTDAKRIREKFQQREHLASQPGDHEEEIDRVNRQLAVLFSTSHIQVLIIVPDGFARNLDEVNRLLSDRPEGREAIPDYGRPIIMHNKADKKSQIAYHRVSDAISAWEKAILRDRLAKAHLPETLDKPVNYEAVDLAQVEDLSQSLWSVMFPALLIIMSVTGAFYPAIDLAAGEKERGTMETLLICPASRTEIVLGKFLTVMTFSTSTALLNLLSMGLTGNYMMSLTGGGALENVGNLTPPSMSALLWVMVLLIPLSALFSALCLSLATFAKSSKEGQYYLTPLLLITLGLTVFCLSPTIEISPFYSVLPIVGPALLLKELLASPDSSGTLLYAIPVLLSSVVFSLLALWWAIEQFSSEDVLFREAERFELGLWLRHLMRDKEATPSFGEAVVCFVLIMLVQFLCFKFFQRAFDPQDAWSGIKLTIINLVVTIACPALFMTMMLTTDIAKTLRLKFPDGRVLLAAPVLAACFHPLSVELMARLDWFFPKLPESAVRMLETMSNKEISIWIVLLAIALTPAICEEIAFRGFILSGLSRSRRKWVPIMLSSLAFGIIHMVPQQVFNATLMGLVLGLIVYQSRSLYPAMLFHFLYNGLQVVRSRVGAAWVNGTPAEWFFAPEGDAIRYRWPLLLIAAVVAAVLIRWLIKLPAEELETDAFNVPVDGESPMNVDVGVKSSVRVS